MFQGCYLLIRVSSLWKIKIQNEKRGEGKEYKIQQILLNWITIRTEMKKQDTKNYSLYINTLNIGAQSYRHDQN